MTRRQRHLASFLLATGLLALAGGSIEQSPEDKKKSEKKAKEAAKQLDGYIEQMGKIHTKLAKLDVASLKPTKCTTKAIRKVAGIDDDKKKSLALRSVYGPFLARFASDDAEDWTNEKTAFGWVTDSAWAGHFREHPSKRKSYSVKDTAKRVQETFAPEGALLVIWPDSRAKNRMPVVTDEGFDSGHFRGWLFVVGQESGDIACQARLFAQNSESVKFRSRGMLKKKPKTAIEDDFEDNLEKAVKKMLPRGVRMQTGWGTLLK